MTLYFPLSHRGSIRLQTVGYKYISNPNLYTILMHLLYLIIVLQTSLPSQLGVPNSG